MHNIFYIWPHDFRWRNNVLGQRLIMLRPLGNLKLLVRRYKRLPQGLNLDFSIYYFGLHHKLSDYISLLTYIFSVLIQLTIQRLCNLISSSDIVYTNYEYSIIIGIWSKYVLGMTWVADFFDDPRRGLFNASSRMLPRWRVIVERGLLSLYRRLLKGADLVVCNAPDVETGLARVLRGGFRVDMQKLVAIPCGVDKEYIADCLRDPLLNEQASDLLRGKGLENQKYIYMVGHINSDVSGVDALLQAVATLNSQGLEYHLLLAGVCKPKQLVWLRTSIREMNLYSHVHYVGEINQSLSYILMEHAAVCVCSYKTKDREDYQTAYPIKLLEYLTVGVPTVTVETPITRLIVNGFESGVLISSSSERDITESVKSLALTGARGPSPTVPLTYRWNAINEALRIALSSVLDKAPSIKGWE
jgi:glycosyltransferase involved in cell wall biosynthesis